MDTDVFTPHVEHLTGREMQVLGLISRGLSNREIAEELVVTPGTVKWYNKQIYRKLGVNSRTKAIAQANKTGLLERAPEKPAMPVFISEHNLPAQLSSFVGREQEINDVTRLLRATRLLTLTGPGGSGKSRLALRVAADVLNQFHGGVFFVDLAPIWDTELVLSTIAGTLGIQEVAGQPLIETIKYALLGRHILLLLDNFEQVIETALYIPELLSSSADLKVMVTSRQALHIYGEQEYTVPSLSIPDMEHPEPLQKLLHYESMQLFYQRAAGVKPDFKITSENASTIAEICVRLDGLPLAIELAAARSKLFSPQVLLARLESRLATLISVSRDVPARLQTLRGTLDWSYDLLEQSERRLLARLAVFQGGGTVESTEMVCGQGLLLDVLDGLESLIDKNLLYQKESLQGEPRFFMLETIHEYAQEKLAESGEAEELKQQHGEYFADLAVKAEGELYGDRQGHWLKRLRLENDNLRAALAWSLDGADPVLGSSIVWALRYFWKSDGHVAEGLRWVSRALAYSEDIPTDILARIYITAAALSFVQGDHEPGVQFARQALQLSNDPGGDINHAWALLELSKNLAAFPGKVAQSITLCEESLALFRDLDNIPSITITLNVLGELSRIFGDYQRAEIAYQECLELSRQTGDKQRIALSLANLSTIAMHHGDYMRAEALKKESLIMHMELNTKYYIGMSLGCLSGPAVMQGHPKRAARLLGASEGILKGMGASQQPADQIEIDHYFTAIREQLDEEAFQEALAEGKGMSLEEAVAFALDE